MELRQLLAAYRDKADLIAIGANERGTDPLVDRAVDLKPEIDAFLRQGLDEHDPYDVVDARMVAMIGTGLPGEPDAYADADSTEAPADPFSTTSPVALPPLNIAV
jgi:flagellum-specific ATP synthase